MCVCVCVCVLLCVVHVLYFSGVLDHTGVATQEVADIFGRPSRIRSCCVYGGASKGPQIRDLQDGMARKGLGLIVIEGY